MPRAYLINVPRANSAYRGYFPFHEDPKARRHRPHPFQHDQAIGRRQSTSPAIEISETDGSDLAMARSDTPVASYLPSGYHNSPLPMGKYYPSNYEQRSNKNQAAQQTPTSGSHASSIKSDSQVPTRNDQSRPATIPESDVRRRLEQYKRDMIAQATLAASEIMGGSSHGRAAARGGLRLEGLPSMDMRFNAPAHKPLSPRLLPLGSPGPVTPMELESSSAGGYIDKGRGDHRRTREGLIPPGLGYTANTT